MALFMPIGWVRVGRGVYATRFDPDDAFHRLLTRVQMLASVGMAVQVGSALEDGW